MCTEATLVMLILISSRLNHERLWRITALSVTSMYVGNRIFPGVNRLALNISDDMNNFNLKYQPRKSGRLKWGLPATPAFL